MKRRDRRVVEIKGKYQVVEIEILHRDTMEVLDVCYEVRERNVFITEFDTIQEALAQLEFMRRMT